jgi:hypothetical protein
VSAELPGLRADFPGWQIEHHANAAGDYFNATLPGKIVKAPDAKRLRQRLAAESGSDYTARAVAAIADAVRAEHDFGGWLADVLCRVAADAGGIASLTAGRPDSWEAGYVISLVRGTAGDDDGLAAYGTAAAAGSS